jgi:hypothetical protein
VESHQRFVSERIRTNGSANTCRRALTSPNTRHVSGHVLQQFRMICSRAPFQQWEMFRSIFDFRLSVIGYRLSVIGTNRAHRKSMGSDGSEQIPVGLADVEQSANSVVA